MKISCIKIGQINLAEKEVHGVDEEKLRQNLMSSRSTFLLLSSLLIAVTFISILCLYFEPIWKTNDDVGMSMVAHGYGIAAVGSPNLICSNVLWGYFIRCIPEINGILGYSTATLGILTIFSMVLMYGLSRLGLGFISCISMLAILVTRPILFPQFTINAGLLMVGAIICWILYARENDLRQLLLGCFLAFSSYLVRNQEFLLVLLIGLPLLPWQSLWLHKAPKIAFVGLLSLIVAVTIFDRQAYQGEEWKAFNEITPLRVLFTDFGVGEHLKNRPDILDKHHFSVNDIEMIANWFYVDPHIADPVTLNTMVSELGPLPTQSNAFNSAWQGVKTFWHANLVIAVLAAFLTMLLRPNWRVSVTWILCISAIFILGLMGRPGVLHVYVPLIGLLLIAPYLLEKPVSNRRNQVGIGVLLISALINTTILFHDSRKAENISAQVRQGLANFPTDRIISWGAYFPFQAVYPVLGTSPSAMKYQLYSLGGFALAPFTVAYAEETTGHGFKELLLKEDGVPLIAGKWQINLLEQYCTEHLHGQLNEISSESYGNVPVIYVQCVLDSSIASKSQSIVSES